jgi:hypothetical protein
MPSKDHRSRLTGSTAAPTRAFRATERLRPHGPPMFEGQVQRLDGCARPRGQSRRTRRETETPPRGCGAIDPRRRRGAAPGRRPRRRVVRPFAFGARSALPPTVGVSPPEGRRSPRTKRHPRSIERYLSIGNPATPDSELSRWMFTADSCNTSQSVASTSARSCSRSRAGARRANGWRACDSFQTLQSSLRGYLTWSFGDPPSFLRFACRRCPLPRRYCEATLRSWWIDDAAAVASAHGGAGDTDRGSPGAMAPAGCAERKHSIRRATRCAIAYCNRPGSPSGRARYGSSRFDGWQSQRCLLDV